MCVCVFYIYIYIFTFTHTHTRVCMNLKLKMHCLVPLLVGIHSVNFEGSGNVKGSLCVSSLKDQFSN